MANDFNEATHDVAEQGKVKCKDCGGILQFSPGQQSLTCIYCGTVNEVQGANEPVVEEEQDFTAYLANATASAETMQTTTVKCGSCGSSTSLQPNVTSDSCPFCGTALVLKGGTTSSTIKPKYLLPFSIDKNKGKELFKKWIGELWWAPNDLKRIAENDKLKGLYIPYWTYDSNTVSNYSGMRGDHYYVTESYTTTENGQSVTKTRQVQKTRWTPASGTVRDDFDDVLINASKSLPEKLAQELEPWDLKELKAFNEQFLTGFISEQYQVDVKEGFDKAKVRMEKVIRGTVNKAIGGDVQQISSLHTTYNN
ncbi:MAG TPA: hypothetical protein VFJ43_10760, partial [Bacteroidia bacterium]|nr:hypothetical protein [Bacteroidia bacterium]